jgi:hypothetical protein
MACGGSQERRDGDSGAEQGIRDEAIVVGIFDAILQTRGSLGRT